MDRRSFLRTSTLGGAAAAASTLAASYCSGPSTSRSGRLCRTSAVASTTLATSAPCPELPVE